MRYAIAGGIGLFITLIGFMNAGFIVQKPATIIGAARLNASLLTFLAGLLFTAVLLTRHIRGAILLGILFTTVAASPLGRWYGVNNGSPLVNWQGIFSAPDFSLFVKLDLVHSLQWGVWPVIFSFVFTDMFDSLSTSVGLSEAAGLLDEQGEPKNIKRSLLVDAMSTTMAGLLGSSPGTLTLNQQWVLKQVEELV